MHREAALFSTWRLRCSAAALQRGTLTPSVSAPQQQQDSIHGLSILAPCWKASWPISSLSLCRLILISVATAIISSGSYQLLLAFGQMKGKSVQSVLSQDLYRRALLVSTTERNLCGRNILHLSGNRPDFALAGAFNRSISFFIEFCSNYSTLYLKTRQWIHSFCDKTIHSIDTSAAEYLKVLILN